MPRLSLFRPEKGNDFRFLDRAIEQQFQIGGVDTYIHKYLGPANPQEGEATAITPTQANDIPELGIQDLLLMENRDRRYEPDVYVIRGIYNMADLDFNLSQFGLFLQNDIILLHYHLKSSVEALGRKIMPGDVIELPHLKDEYALDNSLVALKRFYVVQDVTRPANGFSQTWYPHLVRAKCVPLVDSQEFGEILDQDSGAGDGSTLRDLISTYKQSIDVNNQIIAQAEEDAAKSGFETRHLYTIPERTDTNEIDVADASMTDSDASIDNPALDASIVLQSPGQNIYVGYLTDDAVPPNGKPYGFGLSFPSNPVEGQFFLRTDYMPNRLFRWNGSHWLKFEENVRMTLNNLGHSDVAEGSFVGKDVRQTQKTSFINNNNTATIAGQVVQEKQALSKALKPKADI